MAYHCEGNDLAPLDKLETTGFLDRWEISNEVMNGFIADMLPTC
jgi:hypothetical protein